MTDYVGDDGDNIFTVGIGKHNVDGKGGNDLLILNLSTMVGSLDTFNSSGVMTNNLEQDDPNFVGIGIGAIERVNITTAGGNDEFFLFGGDDTVSSAGGDDDINTRFGKAVVDGGAGRDHWTAELGDLTYDGVLDLSLAGKQAFYGGSVKAIESLSLTLGAGDDTVLTLTGKDGRGTNDTITAGAGDDIVWVGGGQDAIYGGDGDDLAIVDFSGIAGAIDTFNSGGVITNNLTGDKNATVGLSGIERVDITGGDGNDEFYLFGGDDTVHGGLGDDDINTRLGAAVVDGGAGTDLWTADLATSTANSRLDLASSATQAFLGGSVTAVEHLDLTLGSGKDTILTLTGSAGRGLADHISAGAGNDIVRVGGGQDVINGGEGDDLAIIDFTGIAGDIDTFNSGGVITNNLTGDELATVGLSGIERVDITGGAGNDEFYLFGGDDTVHGGAGDDDINTRIGKAVVDGGAGTDLWTADLSASTANSHLDLSESETQAFLGGSVTAVEHLALTLGSGDDTVLTLTGKAGRGLGDTLSGGAGNDTFLVGGGHDVVTGGEGEDTLIIDLSKAKGDFETFGSGGTVTNNLTGADEATVGIGGFEHIKITGGRGDDQFFTTNGSDTIDGGSGADDMTGNAGDDTYYVDNKGDVIHENPGGGVDLVYSSVGFSLVGAEIENAVLTGVGDNRLTGNALANQLTGNGGANVLAGAGGADTLTGGKGDDTFDFNATADSGPAASDRITDLTNKDVIDLSTIDANTGKAGDQSFVLADHFTGKAGELVLTFKSGPGITYLDADVTGDGVADMRIILQGDHQDFDNFVL